MGARESWSFAIARHCDRIGGSAALIDPSHQISIEQLRDDIEPMLHAVRARLLQLSNAHREAALGLSPASLRSLPLTVSATRLAGKFIAAKHGTLLANVTDRLRDGLANIRARLAGRPYVLDRFSYADILCATPLAIVQPVGNEHIPLFDGLRQHMHDRELAAEFADLLQWRDELYSKHRPKEPRSEPHTSRR